MIKITFMGAGSTIFAKNVLGDCLLCDELRHELEIALYDIDGKRLEESYELISALNSKYNNGEAKIKSYIGAKNRKEALRGANFVVNAIQVGGYDPCTIIDFEIPKKYGIHPTVVGDLPLQLAAMNSTNIYPQLLTVEATVTKRNLVSGGYDGSAYGGRTFD